MSFRSHPLAPPRFLERGQFAGPGEGGGHGAGREEEGGKEFSSLQKHAGLEVNIFPCRLHAVADSGALG